MEKKECIVETEEHGMYSLVEVGGYLTANNVLKLRTAFEQSVSIGHSRMAIDLSQVEFIDSVGIGLLVNIKRKLDETEGMFGIINPSKVVSDVFEVSHTDKYFPIYLGIEDLDTIFG